jgi:hypothetical protein
MFIITFAAQCGWFEGPQGMFVNAPQQAMLFDCQLCLYIGWQA